MSTSSRGQSTRLQFTAAVSVRLDPGGFQLVHSLRGRGVSSLGQDELPFQLDDDGISVTDQMHVAWMRDPDGSILTVHSLTNDT